MSFSALTTLQSLIINRLLLQNQKTQQKRWKPIIKQHKYTQNFHFWCWPLFCFQKGIFCVTVSIRNRGTGVVEHTHFLIIPDKSGNSAVMTIERLKIVFKRKDFKKLIGNRQKFTVFIFGFRKLVVFYLISVDPWLWLKNEM